MRRTGSARGSRDENSRGEDRQAARKAFRVFVELEGIYRNVVEQLAMYAVRGGEAGFTKLKALKHRELRALYPQLPSRYAYRRAGTRPRGPTPS